MRRFLVLAAAVAVASSVGCANARYVQKSADEGIVAVPSNTDTWPDNNRTNALKLIEQHVGPYYDIVDEREVTTGHDTINHQDTKREATFNGDVPFLPAEKQTTTTTTTTVPRKDYHIHYRRSAPGIAGRGAGFSTEGATGAAPSIVPAAHSAPAAQSPLPPPDMSGLMAPPS